MSKDNIVLIPSGGMGKRLEDYLKGEKKQFFKINNKSILEYTIERFYDFIDIKEFIIIIPRNENEASYKDLVKKYPNIKFVFGGLRRQDSVYNGLTTINAKDGIVIVHDAVRPNFCKDNLNELIENARIHKAACLGVRARDTIKISKKDDFVDKTLARDKIWLIHTPQAFELNLLKDSYENAYEKNYCGTDDASLVEFYGHTVKIINDDYYNIKITEPDDIKFAKYIFKKI